MTRTARRRIRPFIATAAAVAVVVAVAIILTRPHGGRPAAGPRTASATPAGNPSTEPPPTFVPARNSVAIEPTADDATVVHGTYPDVPSRCLKHVRRALDARYPGRLSVERAGDGTLTLVLSMPFERYLEGIAEVPPSWPMAALEAQAVAARSYALAQTGWTGVAGETLRHPICSTDACQVYAGLPLDGSITPARWVDAVRRTSGQVLLANGRPADALYFSTSNGRTYGNEVVFGSAPLTYLRPVPERDDGSSPEARWKATLPLPDLARFLRAGGNWPADRAITDVRRHGPSITVSGHGIDRVLAVSTVRSDVNAWAHCLQPGRYPGLGSTGARMPLTVPSPWFAVTTRHGVAVLTGRGWGHGVGMVQWGAYGKARRGLPYRRILGFYYGGLRPVSIREPGSIRVIVASGLTSLEIRASAPLAVDGHPTGATALIVSGGERLTVSARPG